MDAIAVPPNVMPDALDVWRTYDSARSRRGRRLLRQQRYDGGDRAPCCALVLAVPAAYGVARFETFGGRVFLFVALVTRMVPPVAIGVPMVGMMRDLGSRTTRSDWRIAHTTISLPLTIWLMSSFFEAVPIELEEAARVDGCSRLGTLVRIVLPIVRRRHRGAAIFAFLASWNEFLFALLLTADQRADHADRDRQLPDPSSAWSGAR